MGYPSHIVLDTEDILQDIYNFEQDQHLPTLDTDAVIQITVEAIRYESKGFAELMRLKKAIYQTDILFSFYLDDMDPISLDWVSDRVVATGLKLRQLFQSYQLFIQGSLCYEYDRMVDQRTMVLRLCRS